MTTLAFGPAVDATERNTRYLGGHQAWAKAVADRLAGAEPLPVSDSRDPGNRVTRSATNPVQTAKFYYQIRSNMCHRGKGGFSDAELARKVLVELVDLTEKTLRFMRST